MEPAGPVQATYNGYGAAEGVPPVDEALAANWLDGFQVDLCEKGVGPNIYHDVAVDKRMDLSALLAALHKRRVEVRRHVETPAERRAEGAKVSAMLKGRLMLPRGIPTLRRIEWAIALADAFTYTVDPAPSSRGTMAVRGPGGVYHYTPPGKADYRIDLDPWCGFGFGTAKSEAADGTGTFTFPLAPDLDGHGFLLERVGRGEVIARVKSPSPILGPMMLHALAKHLRRRYAVMVSPGAYDGGELLIRPKLGTMEGDHPFVFLRGADTPPRLRVEQAMVREDVWQALLGMRVTMTGEKGLVGGDLAAFRKAARETWTAYRKHFLPKGPEKSTTRGRLWSAAFQIWGYEAGNPVAWLVGQNPSIHGFNLGSTFALFSQGRHSGAEIERFLDVLAETALVTYALEELRIPWRPFSEGHLRAWPTEAAWSRHQDFFRALLGIVNPEARATEIARAEQRGWLRRVEEEQAARAKADAERKRRKAKKGTRAT